MSTKNKRNGKGIMVVTDIVIANDKVIPFCVYQTLEDLSLFNSLFQANTSTLTVSWEMC